MAPTNLDSLPAGIQLAIASYLPYETLISLSQVSRSLHDTIKPETIASYEDKLAFVMRAEKDFAKHFPRTAATASSSSNPTGSSSSAQRSSPTHGTLTSNSYGSGTTGTGNTSKNTEHPGNFACFYCFRVRGPEYFDEHQSDAAYDVRTRRMVRLDGDGRLRSGGR